MVFASLAAKLRLQQAALEIARQAVGIEIAESSREARAEEDEWVGDVEGALTDLHRQGEVRLQRAQEGLGDVRSIRRTKNRRSPTARDTGREPAAPSQEAPRATPSASSRQPQTFSFTNGLFEPLHDQPCDRAPRSHLHGAEKSAPPPGTETEAMILMYSNILWALFFAVAGISGLLRPQPVIVQNRVLFAIILIMGTIIFHLIKIK